MEETKAKPDVGGRGALVYDTNKFTTWTNKRNEKIFLKLCTGTEKSKKNSNKNLKEMDHVCSNFMAFSDT